MSAIIEIENVQKSFKILGKDSMVLKGVSLKVEQGDFVIIFGPSGCGKSTLMHTILGLEKPQSGMVKVLNKDVYTDTTEDDRAEFRKNHMGMVYQQSNWVKSLNVGENVRFPLMLHGMEFMQASQIVMDLLADVGMDSWASYMPTELSGGQQQKVALARALVSDPEVLFADEPTGNLDYESGQELMQLLQQLNTQLNKTIVMVSHDLEYLKYAKTAVRMFDGNIISVYSGDDKDKINGEVKSKKGSEAVSAPIPLVTKTAVSASTLSAVTDVSNYYQPTTAIVNNGFWHKTAAAIREMRAFNLFNGAFQLLTFCTSLLAYFITKLFFKISESKFVPNFLKPSSIKLYSLVAKLMRPLDIHMEGSISTTALIEIAMRNMSAKKTRTIIAIGGMAIGIGAIVFLVSLGYGLQELVISRVARLDEMRQADISIQPGSDVKMDDKSMANFKQIGDVATVLPTISVVGTVNFNNSVANMAVYGVTSDYLKYSAIQPVVGKVFDSNELSVGEDQLDSQVKGISTDVNTSSTDNDFARGLVEYSIYPGYWMPVRDKPSAGGRLLGYTRHMELKLTAEEVMGDTYKIADTQANSTRWLSGKFPLWKQSACRVSPKANCEDSKYQVVFNADKTQQRIQGFVAENYMSVEPVAEVLGATTTSTTGDFVEIPGISDAGQELDTKRISLSSKAKKVAVVNRAMLNLLGLKESEALNKTYLASFVVTADLLEKGSSKMESVPTEYTIVGVTPDDKSPVFYVPFIDLRTLGITNYSQMRVVVNEPVNLDMTRKKIEALGYSTTSVADTVAQISTLFNTLRTLLAIVGMVALAVAALGMFNTLTVSLLERTREVGLMKAIGMRSQEVRKLLLTESIIMGIYGGVLGILFGLVMGKVISMLLSIFAVAKGAGYLEISYTPMVFIVAILVISLVIGLVTGIFPARRATKISPLNALRYE